MDFYQQLRKVSHDLGDSIVGALYEKGLLSEKGVENLSLIHNDIAESINDWISDCQSDESEAAATKRLTDEF